VLNLFINMKLAVGRLLDEDEGQGLTEYALILVFIALLAILALTFLGTGVSNVLSTVGKSLA